MLIFGPKNDVISKKGLLQNFNGFFGRNQVISKKKKRKKKVFSEISTVFQVIFKRNKAGHMRL